jgi:hypothetical protein
MVMPPHQSCSERGAVGAVCTHDPVGIIQYAKPYAAEVRISPCVRSVQLFLDARDWHEIGLRDLRLRITEIIQNVLNAAGGVMQPVNYARTRAYIHSSALTANQAGRSSRRRDRKPPRLDPHTGFARRY